MLIDDGTPAGDDFVERTVPRNATQASVVAHLRIQQAAVQRYRLAERRAFYAQAPLVGGMLDIAGDIDHAIVLRRGLDAATDAAIWTSGADREVSLRQVHDELQVKPLAHTAPGRIKGDEG